MHVHRVRLPPSRRLTPPPQPHPSLPTSIGHRPLLFCWRVRWPAPGSIIVENMANGIRRWSECPDRHGNWNVDESHMDKGLTAVRGGNRQGIVEREVLRVVVTLQTPDAARAFEQARKEILVWTQKRSGGTLPAEAWKGEAFEHLAGGRPILAVSLETDEGVVWAIRADEPDKVVAGRVWTTEATIGRPKNQAPQLSVRLKASSPEAGMNISPHVPGFLHQIYEALHMTVGGVTTQPHPKHVRSDEGDLAELISLLQHPAADSGHCGLWR